MMSEFELTVAHIRGAKYPEDVFGELGLEDATTVFKKMCLIVHPDRHATENASTRSAAEVAFRYLNKFFDDAKKKFAEGTYGQRDVAPTVEPPKTPPTILKVGKKILRIDMHEQLAQGDVADIYTGFVDDGPCVVKVAGVSKDNDLLENEAKFLKPYVNAIAKGNPACRYLPTLYDTFLLKGKKTRRVNVLKHHEGYVSLSDVKKAFPYGLDFRDAAWMIRRVLECLTLVHMEGIVHGAVLPDHVLVHPKRHGAKLIDWCYAKKEGEKLVAISPGWKNHYPVEAVKKQPVTSSTDIYMAAMLALYLLERSAPPKILTFFQSCILENPARRPNSAADVYDEFSDLLVRIVGKPSYRELVMPPVA